MIIDAHCHIYPDKIAEKAVHSTGEFYDLPMKYDGKVSTLLQCGERAGVDKFIVQSVATTPKQVASINRFISDTVRLYPDKMIGFGTLHPESDDIERDVNELLALGLHGVKLHPDIQKFKLDDYRCLKIYELCEKNHLPMLIHTGDGRYDYSNPNRLIPILEIYTDLSVVGAHFGGWSIWEEASKKLCDIENFYVDCSSSFYALDNETVKRIISRYGAEHVLFGTDYPMWDPKEELERLDSLGLSAEDKENILWKNAVKAYGIRL